MPAASSFHIATLGCKINQYESQALREAWCAAGRVETADPAAAADIVVISCAVTARAVRDLRQTVAKLRRANPSARVVVTGCAAQILEEEIRGWSEVDLVVPQAKKSALLNTSATPALSGFPPFCISSFARTRAVVKVQDGCSQRCTYCVVPLTRGPSVSRAPAAVLAELQRLFANGVRECILSGINLNNYSYNDAQLQGRRIHDFWDLLAALDAALAPTWAGRGRLRISSLDPAQLDAKALDTLAAARLVCPHLHLALQSGSPEILRRMNRSRYTPDSILEFLQAYARIHPVFGLGVDLLVGFPGENDAQFEATQSLCAALPLSYGHVFPYSRRPGTPAAALPKQAPATVKKERAAILRALAADKKSAFLHRLATLPRLTVALEDRDAGQGTCEFYVECRLAQRDAAPEDTELLATRPLRTGRDHLVVTPLTEPGATP